MPRERRLTVPLQLVPAETVAAVVDDVTSRLDEMENKLTAVLTRVLERAGRTAASSFRRNVTDHLTAAALREADRAALQRLRMGDLGNGLFGYRLRPEVITAAAPSPTSAMLCVKPRPAEAEAIADPDGEPPDYLHVTLVFLGEVEDGDVQAIVEAVQPVAASHAPLTGVVGGYGRFEPAGVGILLPDVPGLVELRVAVTEALVDADLDYARNHGFEAHITIDSDPETDEADLMLSRSGEPLHFDALLLVRGDEIVAELPLVGRPPLTAAGVPDTSGLEKRVERAQDALRQALGTGNEEAIREAKDEVRSAQDALYKAVATPQWTAPGADELLNVDALMKSLRTKTNPVRQALIENILGTTRKLVDPIETNYMWELIPSDEVSDVLLDDVLGWPGEAEDVAGAAITEAQSGTGNLYVLRERGTGKIAAVANVEAGQDSLIVHNIASLGGGTGTTLLQQIARNASIDKMGVRLRATPTAADYYRGLPGFEEGDNLDFHLPAEKASGFAAGTIGGGTSQAAQMFDVTNPLVAKAIASTGEHITSITDTTRANVMKVIDASWQQGLSIPNTAKAIQAAMADAAPVRARMIARTELVGAINGGSLAATQLVSATTGSPYSKQWRTAPGAPNPRHELYEGLDGQTVGLDEAFDVGGESLQYPGDPDGAPEEVINCRCAMTYVDAPPTAAAVRQSIDAPTMWGENDDPRMADL